MTDLEIAHDRAVVAVLNVVDCKDEQAVELVEALTSLVLITMNEFLPEDDNVNKFN